MEDWQVYVVNGFVVLVVNLCGSFGCGFDFVRVIYVDWGDKDMQDLMVGVDYVIKFGVVDLDCLGIGGWSYGVIFIDEVIVCIICFKVVISGVGIGNMYGMYGDDEYVCEYELELGMFWDYCVVWDCVSYLFLYVGDIIMFIFFQCSQIDFNVLCIGVEQMYQVLCLCGVLVQLVVYFGQYYEISVLSYLFDCMCCNFVWYECFFKVVGSVL